HNLKAAGSNPAPATKSCQHTKSPHGEIPRAFDVQTTLNKADPAQKPDASAVNLAPGLPG
ncbi:hypothetical protein ACQKGL_20620, partial [Ensifer adhaerens]|uniref:hypothetical protein n=1 Tax=Ensifer adhaerens TaxID=106592 RepID=UPI003D069EB3